MNGLWKSTRSLAAASLVVATLTTLPLTAQPAEGDKEVKRKVQPAVQQITEQGAVMGAKVTNGLEGERRVELGTIADLVLDARTGELEHAIVASGGTLGIAKKKTAIEWEKIRRDEKHGFVLNLTSEQLAKLPTFDPAKLELLRASARVKDNVADGDEKTDKPKGSDAAPSGMALLLASQLSDCPILAGLDKLGTGAQVMLAPQLRSVAFLRIPFGAVAGAGGESLVVPWSAVRIVEPVGKMKAHVVLPKSQKELQTAPKLEDEGADVQLAKFRHRVYSFYEVKPPAWDSKPSAPGT